MSIKFGKFIKLYEDNFSLQKQNQFWNTVGH